MSLTGQQYQQFTEALLDVFPNKPRLAQMLRFRLDKNLNAISLGTNLQEIIFDLIGVAEAEGWTSQLLAAARESNPGNQRLLAFAQQFGMVASKESRQDLERIIRATNSFLDVAQWRTQLGEMEGRVCRIEIALKGGAEHTYGTGFLVGPDVLLTNYHVMEAVINGKTNPTDVILRFDYKRLADGTTLNPGTEYRLAEDWLIDSSPYSPLDLETESRQDTPQPDHLDYALVRVAGEPGYQPIGQNPEQDAPKRGWIEVSTQEYDFQPNTPLLILQHPKMAPLKLAIDTDAIIRVNHNKTRVRYNTNTEGGSSGSPCFTINWELVALHHAGDPDFIPTYNQGIPMTAILALLEKRGHGDKLGKSALIEKFYEKGATTLDLSNRELTRLPREIWKLTGLTELNLSGNMLRELPAEIGQLTKLKELNLSENSLNNLPDSFVKLQQLVKLDLSRNNLITFPTEVTALINLDSLSFSQNTLINLPDQINKLIHLKSLDLSDNKLSSLPPGFIQLNQLTTLDLSKNQFHVFPSEIGSLTNLRELHLSDNRFTDLLDNISELSYLKELDLSKNRFSSLPSVVIQLSSLVRLNLEDNQLTDLPIDLIKLTNLTWINVQRNPFEELPEFTKITEPYRLFNFLTERAKSQRRPLNETKLLIVGEAGVGKTSTVNRLLNDRYDPQESSTKGITIIPWEIPVNGVNIKVNIWDFGGQEIMHATHQFFLTKRSVYALVLDSRRGEHESRLEYWLKLIRSFAGDSPILVICNKADEVKIDLNWSGLKRKYGIRAFAREVSCKEGKGFDEINELLTQIVKQLKHINDPLPSNWFAVKSEIEQKKLAKDYIAYEEYQQIAASHKVEDAASQDNLLRYLHDLGIVLWFGDDPRLTNTNVLNPEWVTRAVYNILNSHLLFQQKGRLRIDQLKDILDSRKYPRTSHPFIIDIMKHFELCFTFDDSNQEYLLIPDLLQKDEPYTGQWDPSLSFEIHYDVLPGSIISRFIVRMHTYIHQNTYWRNGVVLAYDGARALVRSDEPKVNINVTGPLDERRIFLEIIRANFRAIHATILNIKATEYVPVSGGGIVSYETLLHYERKKQKDIIPEGMSELVSVRQLLEGVDPPEKAREFEEPIELENPIPPALRGHLSTLVDTLIKVPAAIDFTGRSTLLLNIPGADSLNRSSGNARADLNLIVWQLLDLKKTFSQDHRLYIRVVAQ